MATWSTLKPNKSFTRDGNVPFVVRAQEARDWISAHAAIKRMYHASRSEFIKVRIHRYH